MKARTGWTYILLLACCWAAVPAQARRTVDEKLAAAAEGTVEIYNLSGSVSVTGWPASEVEVKGTLGDKVELVFKREGNRVLVRAEVPESNRDAEDSELEIRVPAGSRIELGTVSADVEVGQVKGALELETVSGDIRVSGQPEEIDAHSISGDIDIQSAAPRVAAKSISGRLELELDGGNVRGETVSGDIQGWVKELDRAEFESVSGDIRFEGGLKGNCRLEVKSHSGDVELLLPKDVGADFSLGTFSGDIANDFGPAAHSAGGFMPGRKLNFSAGTGNARVSVRTFSGDISLQKK